MVYFLLLILHHYCSTATRCGLKWEGQVRHWLSEVQFPLSFDRDLIHRRTPNRQSRDERDREQNQKQTRQPLWFAVTKYSQRSFPYYSNCVPFISSNTQSNVIRYQHRWNLEASLFFLFASRLWRRSIITACICFSPFYRPTTRFLVVFTIAWLQAVW